MATTDDSQTSTETHTAGTKTKEVNLCIVCPLQTNRRKTEYLREAIDEWQDIARHTAELLPSWKSYQWDRNNPKVYQIVKGLPDREISAAVAREAAYKATEAFAGWREKGFPGDRPIGEFGDGNYLRVHQQQLTIEENDRGYGAKLNIVPYNPEWFHIDSASYHEEWLERVCDPDEAVRHGSAEVYLHDDGTATLNLTVVSEVEIYEPDDIPRWLGVDLGVNTLYSTACVGVESGEISSVEVESGQEYSHHRQRLQDKRDRLGEKGDLRGVRDCKGDIERYTDWVMDTASKEIVRLALEQEPCGIRFEDLTDYREDAEDPIHDWPYANLQEKVCYKAELAGVPVQFVDPYGTSKICNRCDEWRGRDEDRFYCPDCDYEVHADVNAAINIATGTPVE